MQACEANTYRCVWINIEVCGTNIYRHVSIILTGV